MHVLAFVLVYLFVFCHAKEFKDKLDRFIITCHTTDLECFQRQYRALRDNVLFGNEMLGIPKYQPYAYKYGNSSTCVKLSGLEESELVGISMDTTEKEYSMILELPFKIHQVDNTSVVCEQPDQDFVGIGPHEGVFRRFTGNATVTISYPFRLHKKKGDIFFKLHDENVDLLVEIPDVSYFDKNSKLEAQMYDWSEWAYNVVRHVDAAEHFVIPLTTQLRVIMEQLPLQRFLLLYPEEEYTDLHFKY